MSQEKAADPARHASARADASGQKEPPAADAAALHRLSASELDGRLRREGRFSADDADRFAASLRPSWEPPPRTTSVAPLVAPVAAGNAQPRVHSTIPVPMSGVPMFAVVAIGVVAVGAVIALAVAGGEHERPQGWAQTHRGARVEEASAPAARASPAAPAPSVDPPAQGSAVPRDHAAEPPHPPAEARPPVPGPSAPGAAEPTGTASPAAAPPVQQPAAAEHPPTPAPVPAAAPNEEAAEPPVAATVHLRIATDPLDAKLLMNGVEVPNPFDAELPRGSRRTVQAKAAGYAPRRLTLTLSQDHAIELRLKRKGARAATREKSKAAGGAAFVADSPY